MRVEGMGRESEGKNNPEALISKLPSIASDSITVSSVSVAE